jgi:hypothetical protein
MLFRKLDKLPLGRELAPAALAEQIQDGGPQFTDAARQLQEIDQLFRGERTWQRLGRFGHPVG